MIPNPGIFRILADDSSIVALLKAPNGKLRIFPWGEAPQQSPTPYVTYSVISGRPENMLGDTPLEDNMGTQIDVWGRTGEETEKLMDLISTILEPVAHMTSFDAAEKDTGTRLYRGRMDFDVIKSR